MGGMIEMNRRLRFISVFLVIVLLLCSCGKSAEKEKGINRKPADADVTKKVTPTSAPTATPTLLPTASPEPTGIPEPETNADLANYLINCWKNGDIESIMPYVSELILQQAGNLTEGMFLDPLALYGEVEKVDQTTYKPEHSQDGYDNYFFIFHFAHSEMRITLAIKDLMLCGMREDVIFKEEFDIVHENGVVETCFLMNCDGALLNAVYTHPAEETGTTVLLIPGSGPTDVNEANGALATFRDMANGLAEQGIASLRLEKRTFRYREDYLEYVDLQDEYFDDFGNAITWIKENTSTERLFLLGHSLGSQIAPVLAENNEVAGLILLNGTARHLADVMYDQYVALDPNNAATYEQASEYVKALTEDSGKGYFYYGAPEGYWVDYNRLDTIQTVRKLKLPTLIINSTKDTQIFEADRELWKKELAGQTDVTIRVMDKISHPGYEKDVNDPTVHCTRDAFSEELLKYIGEFIFY